MGAAYWPTEACKLFRSKFQMFCNILARGRQSIVFIELKARFVGYCFTSHVSYFLYVWLAHVVYM